MVHAVRSGQSFTRQASRAPQYAHLNARAKRCGSRRDTRIATPHARARRAPAPRAEAAHGSPEHRRRPLRPRSGRIRSPIR
ncbi:hypothetical protein F3J14_19180 [Burkholderia sp. Tr-862]|nr:hypothetical protein [Burkholderia sp. Tr-862]